MHRKVPACLFACLPWRVAYASNRSSHSSVLQHTVEFYYRVYYVFVIPPDYILSFTAGEPSFNSWILPLNPALNQPSNMIWLRINLGVNLRNGLADMTGFSVDFIIFFRQ